MGCLIIPVLTRPKFIWSIKTSATWATVADRRHACLISVIGWRPIIQNKTDLIIFSPWNKSGVFPNCTVNFDGHFSEAASFVKNLGVLFDRSLGMIDQISLISKQCVYQLSNIDRIQKLTTKNYCKTLVCSLFTSRLDCGNASLYGLSSSSLSWPQRIKNTAARIITRTIRMII